MTPQGYNLLKKILPDSAFFKFRKIIDDRVQTNIDIFSKNFSYCNECITFHRCFSIPSVLNLWCDSRRIFKKIEEAVVSVVSLALKTNKSTYDDLLIKLFEASVL
jgi:hypothetical protein